MKLLFLSVCLVAILAMEVGHSFGASQLRKKRQLTLGGVYNGMGGYKVNAGYKGRNWGVSGSYSHNPLWGSSYGIQLSWRFEQRLSDLERAVVEMQQREIPIQPDADKSETKTGSYEEHDAGYNSGDGSSGTEATDDDNSSTEKDVQGKSRVKRQTGSNSYNGHIHYSKPGGTGYGVDYGHTFDNGRGKVSGLFDHNPVTGDSFGVGYDHTFDDGKGKISGKINYNPQTGTRYGVDYGHTFDNGRGKVSGQINHNPETGTSYGIKLTWKFGERLSNLERAVMEMRRRYER